MKTKLAASLFTAFALLPLAQAWPDAIAPVTVTATVTSSDGPYYTGTKATVKSITSKIGNKEIVQEAVDRRLIPSAAGWKIVCRYDATMEELLLVGQPRFWLSDKDGSNLVSLEPILRIEQLGTTGTGAASVSKAGKVTGTLKRRVLYQVIANYQGNQVISYGEVTVPLSIVGTEEVYYGVAGACTLNTTGSVADELETLVSLSMKFGAFKQE